MQNLIAEGLNKKKEEKIGIKLGELKAYKHCSKDDLRFTFDLSTERQNLLLNTIL